MKILCAYNRASQEIPDTDPREELVGHDVAVVYSYEEAGALMCDVSHGVPSFDVVLMDVSLPWTINSVEIMPSILLMRHIDSGLIRGIGVLVPAFFESEFSFHHDEYHAIVADRSCWTIFNGRDWSKLLQLVIANLEELEC